VSQRTRSFSYTSQSRAFDDPTRGAAREGNRLLLALDGGLHAQQHEADGEADEGDGEAGDGNLGNLGANRRELREGERGGGGGGRAAGAGDELGGAVVRCV